MKKILMCLILTAVSDSYADDQLFDSYDIKSLEQQLSNLPTGQFLQTELGMNEVSCRVNSMHEMPGYRCTIFPKDKAILITSTDIANLKKMAEEKLYQLITLTLESGARLTCYSGLIWDPEDMIRYSCSVIQETE